MAQTETVKEAVAGGHPVRKHPGNVKVDDIQISCGAGMTEQFYDWLKKSLEYDHERKEGAIVTANYDYKEVTRVNFYQSLIGEIGFPALDATSKETCKFNVKIVPEWSETKYSGGTQSVRPVPIDQSKQKLWVASNFRLAIDGMDCKRTTKVDAIVIKQNIIDNTIGERLIFEREPSQIDFPNVSFTINEIDAEPWYKWYDDFVVKGKSTPQHEKNGSLDFLTSNLSQTLFSLDFENLGIIKLTPDKLDSGSDKLRYIKVEMYCESMRFKYFNNSHWQ